MKVAIIGAGGTGSAAAHRLARAGHSVTVYERFTLDHDRGSSYGGSRLIRRTYPDPLYTKMMGLAYELWADLERESRDTLFRKCGGLTFGRQGNPDMAQTESSLQTNGIGYETLDSAESMRRFPPFRLDHDQYGIYQEDSGLLQASKCVRAQMRLAQMHGAELRENVTVASVRATQGRVKVSWDGGTATYDRVLLTSGPWMADLLPPGYLSLTVTRQTYAHFAPRTDPESFEIGAFPVWIDLDTLLYGFPRHDDLPGVKIASHQQGEATDAENVRRTVTDTDRALLTDYAARRLPSLDTSPIYEKTCLYTNTPDEDFVIDAVPNVPGAYFCSGCSGHGFKFTVLLGQILACLTLGEEPPTDLTRFRADRFAS